MMEAAQSVLASLRATHQPPSATGKVNLADRFRLFRSEEWDALRNHFRDAETAE